ncbi:demethoxyubiquinone hydroxylase family protein [Rhodothalassium salexigens]|uniref:demethoxyubiquinone hydroxylase family protein n=1 Tax=Rhodothalassium salexigens TaxID=1086 RepID=UPI0019148EDD|nr:demethoxyubiquinone hydroxylase family protein [Rhodothalassium salexigens]MBK5921555.1 demethoxyubiquinone hydroxylase family protein [Rhodothalassium salexigens]
MTETVGKTTPPATDAENQPRPLRPLPGDRPLSEEIKRMIRVDHAGEYGAAQIYAGQLAVLGHQHRLSSQIRHMKEQEQRHLDTFDRLVIERQVRPTAVQPLWRLAGFGLGAATALMGERALMACTAAVEEVIDDHYADQERMLAGQDADLAATVAEFRAEEAEHRDIAIEHGAEQTPGYGLISGAIKAGCKAAIWVSKRL